MYKRKDIEQFFNGLVDEIQEKVYGRVNIIEDVMIKTYKICIINWDIKWIFDLTNKVYEIKTEQDKDKLIYDIIQEYKRYILDVYIVE